VDESVEGVKLNVSVRPTVLQCVELNSPIGIDNDHFTIDKEPSEIRREC
jgi:hypothetical protein